MEGSQVTNLGPAAVMICDCDTDPECTISDLDEPCGYHQTIEAGMSVPLATEKSVVHIINLDGEKEAKVRIKVTNLR